MCCIFVLSSLPFGIFSSMHKLRPQNIPPLLLSFIKHLIKKEQRSVGDPNRGMCLEKELQCNYYNTCMVYVFIFMLTLDGIRMQVQLVHTCKIEPKKKFQAHNF